MNDDSFIPLIDLAAVHADSADELRAAFDRVLASGVFTFGPEVEAFERSLTSVAETPHTVGLGSGTAALHLIFLASGIGPGDEVILPPNTFFATAEAVVAVGATPVFADIDPRTALLDADAAEAAVTPRTAAIVVVHLYGQPVDGDRFRQIARRHRLALFEEAAQAIGGAWRDTAVGALGDAAAFSFYPGKNLGALGEAGAVTTADGALAERIRQLRSHGEAGKHHHVRWGFNERMDELQAAFLAVKLANLQEGQRRRDEAADRYRRLLTGMPDVTLLETAPGARHVNHLMVVSVPNRDAVLDRLHAAGIGASVHYPVPIHLQPAAQGTCIAGPLPHAEHSAATVLSLPLFPGISEDQQQRCVDSLRTALRKAA